MLLGNLSKSILTSLCVAGLYPNLCLYNRWHKRKNSIKIITTTNVIPEAVSIKEGVRYLSMTMLFFTSSSSIVEFGHRGISQYCQRILELVVKHQGTCSSPPAFLQKFSAPFNSGKTSGGLM